MSNSAVNASGLYHGGAMRLWIDGEGIRLARDRKGRGRSETGLQPEHLEHEDHPSRNGWLTWRPHEQGGVIPAVTCEAFVDWLGRGGS